MRRSLIHYWRIHLAVAAAAAVTTAVLTGALMVGDSVRGSLRALTLERLGGIEHALLSQRFFREELVGALSGAAEVTRSFELAAPAILMPATVLHSESRRRASAVQAQGVDVRFLSYFRSDPAAARIEAALRDAAGPTTPAAINESLARELGAAVGDSLLLSLERPASVPPEFLLGSREPVETLRSLRLTVGAVIADRGVGRFSLQPHQALPLGLFLPLAALQRALEQDGRANALLVGSRPVGTDGFPPLEASLQNALRPADLGIELRTSGADLIVESREMVLSPTVAAAVERAAGGLRLARQRVFTYLANSITAGGLELPYSTVAALEPSGEGPFRGLTLADGSAAPRLGPGEILLNRWAADDLRTGKQEAVGLRYFVVGPREQLSVEQAEFQLREVVSMEGLGADRSLTPRISGIQDADNMADWDPPIPIDLGRVRPADEDYWDRWEAAPKAFISYADGARLWRSRFGAITSIRLPGAAERRAELETALLSQLDPAAFGLTFQPVRQQGLAAASGATDFGMLFISFSFFIIVSAALLVGLLFRLGVEQRSRELGLLLALGFGARAVNRRFLSEGLALAVVGVAVGSAGAVLYGWLLIAGLKTLWSGAIGSPFLRLYVEPTTLAIGGLAALATIAFSIWRTVRSLAAVPSPVLLAGGSRDEYRPGSGRISAWLAWGGVAVALLLLATAGLELLPEVVLFFGVGIVLLISGLAFFSRWLRRSHSTLLPGAAGLRARLGARNSGRSPGRSLMAASLIASACFVIVAVGANRHEPGAELLQRDSGAGGFPLLARSEVPLHQDLNSEDGLFDLGFSDAEIAELADNRVFPLRYLPGQDVSCLNLYQPERPRVLGVGEDLIARGGFSFQSQLFEADNPWTLLDRPMEPGVIPAFGDANSVMWILHLGLGDDVVLVDESGAEVRLRLVGLLSRSIFQGEILVSEANFLRHFPSRGGFSYFLVDAPDPDRSATLLESRLADFGVDANTTPSVLAGYLAVENTYLSTFQTLGGLGLLLGTLGLGVVLVRNVLERRGELATMRAFGFRRRWLAAMVMLENAFLLVLGLAVGAGAALLAVGPHLLASGPRFPWVSLAGTVAIVLLVGLAAGLLAVRAVLRMPLLDELKSE